MATLKKKENDMFTSLFPNKSHNIQMEPTPPEWRLSSEAEVLHLEMEADLAAPCGSLVVVIVVVVVVLDVQRAVLLRGRLYEASMARRAAGAVVPVVPPTVSSFQTCSGDQCDAKAGVGFDFRFAVRFGTGDRLRAEPGSATRAARAEGLCSASEEAAR